MNDFEGMEKQIGFRVNRDVYSNCGILLISASTILTEKHIRHLIQHKVSLSIDLLEPVENRSKELIEWAVSEVKDIFEIARQTQRIPIEEVQRDLVPRIERLADYPGLFQVLMDLQEVDDYTYRHNVAVGIISTVIGKWLDYDDESLKLLSVSASLHDIGKVKIPSEILKKSDKLTIDEFTLMKEHTVYGFEILSNSIGSTSRMAYVALQHHEREDGSGYPFGLSGSDVDPFSKIVAVADVFHAMTSKRVYKDPTPFYIVLKKMMENAFGVLDPGIVRTFILNLMDSLLGCMVSLSDGRQGVMVMINNDTPLKPLIRIGDSFVDLKTEQHLNIESIL